MKIPSSIKPRARRRSSLCKPPRRVSGDVPGAPIPATVFTAAAAAASSNPNINISTTITTAATMSSSDMDFDQYEHHSEKNINLLSLLKLSIRNA